MFQINLFRYQNCSVCNLKTSWIKTILDVEVRIPAGVISLGTGEAKYKVVC